MTRVAHIGSGVFDGTALHHDAALLITAGQIVGIVPRGEVPQGYDLVRHAGGTIFPGFVDLQVNGGGGVMFNDTPTPNAIQHIADAHATTGTRGLLPTLITDTPDKTTAAIHAAVEAIDRGIPGVIGLHLEGPHLSSAKAGAHDPELIRPMTDADEAELVEAAARLPNLMVTLAPETVEPIRIERLAKACVIVALGHSNCSYEIAKTAIDAGARVVTHLFNAMSQITARDPGLVGAALDSGQVSSGLIADGIHVHPAAMRAALKAKAPPGQAFLVSDAMATAASEITEFTLNGRQITRRDGRLTLSDGTLAGADLEMARALRCIATHTDLAWEDCLAMATSIPADVLTDAEGYGRLIAGSRSTAIHLSEDRTVVAAL